MPQVEIIRKQTIAIDTVGENSYHDLTFTDKEGNSYKVSAKRVQYFQDVIISGQTVQLNYAKFKGNEYVYSAEKVEGQVSPPVTESIELKKTLAVTDKQAVAIARSLHDKTDERIALQVAVKAIVEMAGNGTLLVDDPLTIAVKQWCADQLRNYLPPDTVKPSDFEHVSTKDAIVEDNETAKRMLIKLVQTNLKYPQEKTAISWLQNVAKVGDRLETEAGDVAKELIQQYNWK